MKKITLAGLLALQLPFMANSAEEIQDMSGPLAVYTQAGAGATNKGINLKAGKSYDPGAPNVMAMNVIEVKGALGEAWDWDGSGSKDNSADSVRFRNFKVDTTNGRGTQIDVNFGLLLANI